MKKIGSLLIICGLLFILNANIHHLDGNTFTPIVSIINIITEHGIMIGAVILVIGIALYARVK